LYIRKRWILLFFTIVIVSGSWYLYRTFFAEDRADQVCCEKQYLTVPKVLTILESEQIPILDSSKANQQITYNILNQVQEGLMRLGKDNVPVPGLAESYQVSPDYKTYTFTLRKQAVWSDGQPVTAKDFQYAWLRALSPEINYERRYLLYGIEGAELYAEGKIAEEKVGIKVNGERQLTIQLTKPDPNFLSLVTLTPFLPVRQDLVEKYGEKYAEYPDTMSYSGPFIIKSFIPERVELEKNDKYWDAKNIYLSGAIIQVEVDAPKTEMLFRSELAAMAMLGDLPEDQTGVFKVTRSISNFLEMNENKRLWQNKFVRQAVQLQLQQLEGLPDTMVSAKGLLPPGTLSQNKDLHLPVEQAKQLLEKGLTELGLSGDQEILLLTYDDEISVALAEKIRDQLAIIGFTVKIEKLTSVAKTKKKKKGEFDLSLGEWSLKYPDALEFLSRWSSDPKVHLFGFADPKYDSLLQQASITADPTKRIQLLQQAERYLIEEQAAVVPLAYINDIRLQKPYVKNVLYHPFGADYSLKWASYTPPKQVEATK
jgi:oligopeptide transport system substrate-binding protein